ncbi:MAG: transcriptional regulator, AraC family [Herbinix sp.]|nr:transcriptional regulator, AraC family [Herbinix sp.]
MHYVNYHEDKIRGTRAFPIEYYYIDHQHLRYSMPYHWHMEYEIIRILEGSFTVSLDKNEFTVEKGDIIFISDGTLHAGIPHDCVYECLVFDLNLILKNHGIYQNMIQNLNNHGMIINSYIPKSNRKCHQIVKDLFDAMAKKKDGYQLITLGTLYQFLGTVYEQGLFTTDSTPTSNDYNRILNLKRVFELIETSYSSVLTLEQLSHSAGMSPKYFCRFFQEMTHQSPISYLNYYRIEQACFQLLTTNLPITEIALNCGFNDLSYFIKTFGKYKGITPKKYKKIGTDA